MHQAYVPVVGVVTTMWKRHALTDIVFSNLAFLRDSLRDVIDLRLVVAGSEGEASQTLAERHGFTYVEVPNSPLGAKWNAALTSLRGQAIDGVCIVGSDDLLDAAYFRMVAESVRNGEKLFGLDAFYVLDRFTGRMFLWKGYAPPRDGDAIGLGRFIHREIIEALDWKLWQEDARTGLDSSMRKRIQILLGLTEEGNPFALKSIADMGSLPVDLKHEQQMWPYEITAIFCHHLQMIGAPRALLETGYPNELVAQVFALCPVRDACSDQYLRPWDREAADTTPSHETLWEGGEKVAYYHHHVQRGIATDVMLPFSQRFSLTFIPAADGDPDLPDLAESFLRLRQERGAAATQLCFPDMDIFYANWLGYGLGGYGIGNLHIWRNMFRVYLVGASPGGAHVVRDLARHGNVVICTSPMRDYFPDVDAVAFLVAETWGEALVAALYVHEKEKLWTMASKKALLQSASLG